MQDPSPGLTAVGVEQRLARWLGIYAIALFGAICFLAGLVPETILLIFVAEAFLLLWQPRPGLGASAFRPPAPDRWQGPIAAVRWAGLANDFWNLAVAGVLLGLATVVLMFILAVVLVRSWPYHLGAGNFVVLVILGAWLASRQVWITPLRSSLKGGARTRFSQFLASMSLTPDGVQVDLRPVNAGRFRARQQVFSAAFAEVDEVRMMDGLAAQGYQLAMERYDPTLEARTTYELYRFLSGQIPRPTLCIGAIGLGTHVLMRSSTLLYLIGNADQTAPDIVASWDTWQRSHQMPAPPG